ncbi:uncharacterized protein N7496_011390 [Penicillium cataractarum]|uniref:Uncharacterized protein n=1 Tax=Penicillium cataractarum TaxID=2100454 RepID=A0A9W9UVJ5_9EURO|nr:uncharacterized protein N7496_011390 [Penicillium cataractarum]KAJ5358977.1 hypothetical protein N7496_011390 [Penicillium cataractarum]
MWIGMVQFAANVVEWHELESIFPKPPPQPPLDGDLRTMMTNHDLKGFNVVMIKLEVTVYSVPVS